MRPLFETSMICSLEGFLLRHEAEAIQESIAAALAGRRAEFEVRNRERSVHELPGVSTRDVIDAYEPRGRIEFDEVPREAGEIASAAVRRRLADIRRAFPSVTSGADWLYFEYAPGQHITPHVDYPIDDEVPGRPKYAAIGVVLSQCVQGGEFFVETCGDPALWDGDMLVAGATSHAPWFQSLRRTRWHTRPEVGDALCWGTQVIHGTAPVREGTAGRLVGFLY